jgi:hypothetical protein
MTTTTDHQQHLLLHDHLHLPRTSVACPATHSDSGRTVFDYERAMAVEVVKVVRCVFGRSLPSNETRPFVSRRLSNTRALSLLCICVSSTTFEHYLSLSLSLPLSLYRSAEAQGRATCALPFALDRFFRFTHNSTLVRDRLQPSLPPLPCPRPTPSIIHYQGH